MKNVLLISLFIFFIVAIFYSVNYRPEFKYPEDVLEPIETLRIKEVDVEVNHDEIQFSILPAQEYSSSSDLHYYVEFGIDEYHCWSRGIALRNEGRIELKVARNSMSYSRDFLERTPQLAVDGGIEEKSREDERRWNHLMSNLDAVSYIDVRVSLDDYLFFYKGSEGHYGYQTYIDIRRLDDRIIDRRQDTMYLFNDYSKSGLEALQRMLQNYYYLPHFDELY